MKFVRRVDGQTGLIVAASDPATVVMVEGSLGAFARSNPTEAAVITGALPGGASGPWSQMIERWDEVREALGALVAAAQTATTEDLEIVALDGLALAPPLPFVDGRVFAVGANFAPHAAHSQAAIAGRTANVEAEEAAIVKAKREGLPPWGFSLLPGTFVGPDAEITPPPGTEKLDYEAEVAVIFRAHGTRRGPDVTPWGYTAWNDLSIRDPHLGLGVRVDHGPMTWTLQKNFDTSNACGPCVVVDEGDPRNVRFTLHINGEQRQEGNTADMVYSFADVIDHLSTYLSMRSGDIVVSGTTAGTALESGLDGPYLQDGDVVSIEVEGVGILRNRIALPARPHEPANPTTDTEQ